MTQTPNIGLKKIDGSENWRSVFDYHNDSMDLADEAIAGVRAGLTYVENGDTIAANASYTEGKFICWKGEIYRILTTINTTVTSANWTTYLTKMDGIGGALSQINGDLTALNSKLIWEYVDYVPLGNYASLDFFVNRGTKMGIIRFSGNQNPVPVGDTSFTIPSSVGNSVYVFVAPLYSNTPAFISVNQGDTGYIRFASAETWAAGMIFFVLA